MKHHLDRRYKRKGSAGEDLGSEEPQLQELSCRAVLPGEIMACPSGSPKRPLGHNNLTV